MSDVNANSDNQGWEGWDEEYQKRLEEGRTRLGAGAGAVLGGIGDWWYGTQIGGALRSPFERPYEKSTTTPYVYDWTDPYQAALDVVAKGQEDLANRYRTFGNEAYSRYLAGMEPARAAGAQQVQAAWDQALGEMGGQTAAVNALARMAEEDNLRSAAAAQAAGTALAAGRGGAPRTVQTGMGGATNVDAYDLANAAAIAGATQGEAARGRLGAQASGMDYLRRTLAAAPASWQSQMRLAAQIQDAQQRGNIDQRMSEQLFNATERQRAREEAIAFEREQSKVLIPAYKNEYNKLSGKDKKELKDTLGIDNADEYVFYQMRMNQSQSGALGTMATGE